MDTVRHLFKRLQTAIESTNFPPMHLKPRQVKCFESILLGSDLIAVLPTGYGKSLIYQLLPFFLEVRCRRNIVIVISPLFSIIEDQISLLSTRGVKASVLHCTTEDFVGKEKLFSKNISGNNFASDEVNNGDIDILFSHPEELLSDAGRELMKSKVFQENVIGFAIDEAHCVVTW